jgi:hypothetical protein
MKIKIEFRLQDLWIGAFWDNDKENGEVHLYICLIPMFPIYVYWQYYNLKKKGA